MGWDNPKPSDEVIFFKMVIQESCKPWGSAVKIFQGFCRKQLGEWKRIWKTVVLVDVFFPILNGLV